jgi:zinc protease
MIKRTFQLIVFLFSAFAVFSQQLPLDEKIRTGQLPNGLTYYIRYNKLPEQRADFYIAQKVGSMQEEENQRGLAHFLEHMAFNGTKNFPGMNLREYLQDNGVKFGENLNAYTSIDETVYMINNIPTNREGLLDSALLILHDWSSFLLLTDEDIDKERGVIREEWRTRNNASSRMYEKILPEVYGDDRYGHRLPIGLIDVINNFKYQELRDYYHRWYRPDLQGIIIVGDIDTDKMEEKIKALFSDIPTPENPAKRIYFPVTDNKEPIVSIATDPEATRTNLMLFNKHAAFPEGAKNTQDYMVISYIRNMVAMMINERYGEIVQDKNSPFVSVGASDESFLISKTKDAWTSAANVKEGQEEDALSVLVEETRRVLQYGFTETEYDRARAEFLRMIESAYLERDKQKNDSYVQEYISLFLDKEPSPGIEFEYNFYNELAPIITVDAVNEYLSQIVSFDGNVVIILMMPKKEGLEVPTKEELLAVFNKAKEKEISPYEDKIIDTNLIKKQPKKGKIKSEKQGNFGTEEWILSNGIKVVFKQTDFKEDQILMKAVSLGGTSLLDEKDMPTINLLNDLISLGGVGDFSKTDLSKALAGKKVSVSPAIGLRTEVFSGSSSPSDFDTMMQLVYLYMTSPRIENEAFEAYISRKRSELQNNEMNPFTTFIDSVNVTVYGNNPRVERMKLSMLDNVDYNLAMKMYQERFMNADEFTFIFVGNINTDSVRTSIEKYIASLPKTKERETFADVKLNPIKGERSNIFDRKMETDKTTVLSFYSGEIPYTLQNNIYMNALYQIMNIIYTEKIREEQGGTYGVQVYGDLAKFSYPQYKLQIMFDTDPDLLSTLLPIVYQEIENIETNGPKEADFNKVKEFMLKKITEMKAENSYWLGVIDEFNLTDLDIYTEYENILNAMQISDIQNFAKEIFEQGNRVEVVMNPEK